MMNNKYTPLSPVLTHPIFNSKSLSQYIIYWKSLRGSYGWSKGYSMFLKHMFKAYNTPRKRQDNLKENGNQMKEKLMKEN